jgi:sulfite reductase (NADPH) flavoprotein alpha-component
LRLYADAKATEPQTVPAIANEDETDPLGSRANPFAAELIDNRRITGAASDKEVRHIAFSLTGSPIAYEPGDALGVVVENSSREVEAVLASSSLDGAAEVELDGKTMRLQDALRAELSIGRLTQASVIKFAKLSNDPELLALIEPERGQDLAAFVYGRDLIDLLLNYPGVIASPSALATLLPRLQPRLYSISSSPKAHPGEVHLTVATVRYESHGRKREGVASGYLASLETGAPVRIYAQTNKRFRLPKDGTVPVIMIGPGTGVAPFRAFLEERRASGAKGGNWLFFGDRRAATDYLYREELESFRSDGTLTRLDTAFSRDQAEKVYVQTRMLEQAEELGKWLADGAHVYVCGDAQYMAKDVDRALRAIVARYGKLSDAQAQIQVNQMAAEGRYLRDVY